MTEPSDRHDNTEARLRAELADCQAKLAETRAVRDQANRAIRALLEQETLLSRLVAVFDRAADRAKALHPSTASTKATS